MPCAYRGKNGQAHKFDWQDCRPWIEQNIVDSGALEETAIDDMDWHQARTVSARERAKRDRIETAALERRYVEAAALSGVVEDLARQAVLALRALPARIAPRLAALDDELAIGQALDEEIRTLCTEIERGALRILEEEPDLDMLQPSGDPA
ncbi:hypothetical protein [Thiorhodococcus minor]|uniref:Uncharacterized protein n=1 Tax=Thiorhodococcus minor TaxID=57489 RepID=A0A6M0K1R5_9GAMM|nr:hypothetical protein [Thiorhodococcus minor]NEV62265.1 hypothetical protein [Thiorhodococcus minor]